MSALSTLKLCMESVLIGGRIHKPDMAVYLKQYFVEWLMEKQIKLWWQWRDCHALWDIKKTGHWGEKSEMKFLQTYMLSCGTQQIYPSPSNQVLPMHKEKNHTAVY
jgi:hypothetical protein